MAENCFHPSIEGAQHGTKSLVAFLDYAKKSGAAGAQPSNFMLNSDKGLKSAKEIKSAFAKAKLKLDATRAANDQGIATPDLIMPGLTLQQGMGESISDPAALPGAPDDMPDTLQ